MADFKKAFQKTMKTEGGYVNDPVDRGGETYKGIARNFWKGWAGWVIIDVAKGHLGFHNTVGADKETRRKIDEELAKNEILQNHVLDFYKQNFWDVLNLDDQESQMIAEKSFDIAVNMGTKTAREFLETALGEAQKEGGKENA